MHLTLVRLHLFQDLDDKTSYSTAVTKLPSFKAMTDFALKDELVKVQFAEERKEQAEMSLRKMTGKDSLSLIKQAQLKIHLEILP